MSFPKAPAKPGARLGNAMPKMGEDVKALAGRPTKAAEGLKAPAAPKKAKSVDDLRALFKKKYPKG